MRNKKKILDTQSPMRKLKAEPSVKSNTEVEIEENTKLTVKTSTASKDDKTEADQKSPSTAEPPSLRTKAVDKILTGRKNPDLTPENFPVMNKTEDNQIEETQDTGENGRKNSKNMPHLIVEPRSHRGHTLKEENDKPKNSISPGSIPLQEMVASKSEEKEQLVKESPTPKKFENFTKGFGSKMLEKFGWVKGTAINNTPGAIIAPLFEYRGFFDGKPVTILKQITTPQDERRFKLNNDLTSLLADDYKEDNNEEKPPFLPASLEWFHLGSFEAPLVRNVKSLSISEKTQQDPPRVSQEAKLTPKEKPSCLRQKEVTSSRE